MPIWSCVFKIFFNISYAHFSQLYIGCVCIYYLFLCLFSPLAIHAHMEGARACHSLTLSLCPSVSLSVQIFSLWLHFISSLTFRLIQHSNSRQEIRKGEILWYTTIIYWCGTGESWMLRLLGRTFCYTSIVSIRICIKCVVFCCLFASFVIDTHFSSSDRKKFTHFY